MVPVFWIAACAAPLEESPGSVEDTESDVVVDEGPRRVVAFGDVHGDYDAARKALQLAGVMDGDDQWVGGTDILVQVGDQLDRGDGEREILDLFEHLRVEAAAAGGAFYPLLGNHEVMNIELDFRYVTPGGFDDFSDIEYATSDEEVMSYPRDQRGRVAAFRPGGEYALYLAEHYVIVQVEDSVFVHGGVLPDHVDLGLDRINENTQAWMRGERRMPDVLESSDAPTWSRHYSDEPTDQDCGFLADVLDQLGASRMVVAHTVQERGINPACQDQVWRVDVGMAAHYGGTPEVLEIIDGQVDVITE
jgi:hypothetical protein